MNEENDKESLRTAYRNLLDKYHKSNMIAYGRPDNFQFQQNELIQSIAEFLLQPCALKFFQFEEQVNEQTEK